MKCKGFTLIEIVSSLLIFAAGGTMALSVFNYNAANRVEILERMEAFDLASGFLNTLVLRSQTDETWKTTATAGIKDGLTWSAFQDINIQSLEPEIQAEDVKRNSINVNGAANFLKSGFNAFTELSGYQWRFRLIPATMDTMEIKRSKIFYRKYSSPALEKMKIDDHYILQLEVSWPRDELTADRRKKVLLNTVVSCS